MKDSIKIWAFSDQPIIWVAAASKSEAIELLESIGEMTDEVADDVEVVKDSELDRLTFRDPDGTERTFRQQLCNMIMRGETFPEFFASTDYD